MQSANSLNLMRAHKDVSERSSTTEGSTYLCASVNHAGHNALNKSDVHNSDA